MCGASANGLSVCIPFVAPGLCEAGFDLLCPPGVEPNTIGHTAARTSVTTHRTRVVRPTVVSSGSMPIPGVATSSTAGPQDVSVLTSDQEDTSDGPLIAFTVVVVLFVGAAVVMVMVRQISLRQRKSPTNATSQVYTNPVHRLDDSSPTIERVITRLSVTNSSPDEKFISAQGTVDDALAFLDHLDEDSIETKTDMIGAPLRSADTPMAWAGPDCVSTEPVVSAVIPAAVVLTPTRVVVSSTSPDTDNDTTFV